MLGNEATGMRLVGRLEPLDRALPILSAHAERIGMRRSEFCALVDGAVAAAMLCNTSMTGARFDAADAVEYMVQYYGGTSQQARWARLLVLAVLSDRKRRKR